VVSVYRVALLLKVMMSTNAQSALKKEKKKCAPRAELTERGCFWLTTICCHCSRCLRKSPSNRLLDKCSKDHGFRSAGIANKKREKTTWTWKPARQFRLPQKKAGPRESGNPRGIKSIPCHPFMASIYNFPPIHCKHETRGSVDRWSKTKPLRSVPKWHRIIYSMRFILF